MPAACPASNHRIREQGQWPTQPTSLRGGLAPTDGLSRHEVFPMSWLWYMDDPAFASVLQGLRHTTTPDWFARCFRTSSQGNRYVDYLGVLVLLWADILPWLGQNPTDQYPDGSAFVLLWMLVLACAWAMKRVAASAWKRCVGWHEWVRLGVSCQLRTGSRNRSIVAMRLVATEPFGRACWPTCRPIRTCPPCGDSTAARAHERGGGGHAQKERGGACPQP